MPEMQKKRIKTVKPEIAEWCAVNGRKGGLAGSRDAKQKAAYARWAKQHAKIFKEK